MQISKDAAVKGIGAPEGEELERINALARRELEAEEVYTFALRSEEHTSELQSPS